jgi:hypothetical protein
MVESPALKPAGLFYDTCQRGQKGTIVRSDEQRTARVNLEISTDRVDCAAPDLGWTLLETARAENGIDQDCVAAAVRRAREALDAVRRAQRYVANPSAQIGLTQKADALDQAIDDFEKTENSK